jgi:hypothetical protein
MHGGGVGVGVGGGGSAAVSAVTGAAEGGGCSLVCPSRTAATTSAIGCGDGDAPPAFLTTEGATFLTAGFGESEAEEVTVTAAQGGRKGSRDLDGFADEPADKEAGAPYRCRRHHPHGAGTLDASYDDGDYGLDDNDYGLDDDDDGDDDGDGDEYYGNDAHAQAAGGAGNGRDHHCRGAWDSKPKVARALRVARRLRRRMNERVAMQVH